MMENEIFFYWHSNHSYYKKFQVKENKYHYEIIERSKDLLDPKASFKGSFGYIRWKMS